MIPLNLNQLQVYVFNKTIFGNSFWLLDFLIVLSTIQSSCFFFLIFNNLEMSKKGLKNCGSIIFQVFWTNSIFLWQNLNILQVFAGEQQKCFFALLDQLLSYIYQLSFLKIVKECFCFRKILKKIKPLYILCHLFIFYAI